jgi:hypothetical protein
MPYAIIFYFDPTTEEHLTRVQESLLPLAEDAYYKDARPHVSLTGFDGDLPPDIVPTLQVFSESIAPIELILGSVGVFPGEKGVVFLAPVVTPPLLEIHAKLHDLLRTMNVQTDPYFQPGFWVPHSTMAMNIPAAAIPKAVETCLESGTFGSARLVELGLVQFPPVEERALFTLPR